MKRKGWKLANRCVLCKTKTYTVKHMLESCSFTKNLYQKMEITFHIRRPLISTMVSMKHAYWQWEILIPYSTVNDLEKKKVIRKRTCADHFKLVYNEAYCNRNWHWFHEHWIKFSSILCQSYSICNKQRILNLCSLNVYKSQYELNGSIQTSDGSHSTVMTWVRCVSSKEHLKTKLFGPTNFMGPDTLYNYR